MGRCQYNNWIGVTLNTKLEKKVKKLPNPKAKKKTTKPTIAPAMSDGVLNSC